MSENTCNVCGANLIYKDGRWVCPACGAYKEEEISNEEVTLLYNASQKLRLASFDDAEELYADIVKKYPKNSEAHWGLVLSRYGIKYEDDYDGRKLPTCYAATMESFLDDKEYLAALSCAPDAKVKAYYAEQGKIIEKNRIEWYEKASKEPAYDVFLCFKDSDKENNIERTDDSIEVANLYTYLSGKGYRVFFSRETLRDKVAEKYEPYIYNALNTASVMIVYGSKPEYFESVWMKNEWTRFLKRMREGLKVDGSLIVAYDGMNPAELPKVFSKLQCLDARKKTFYGDLEEQIKRVIDRTKHLNSTEKAHRDQENSERNGSSTAGTQVKTTQTDGTALVGKKAPKRVAITVTLMVVALLISVATLGKSDGYSKSTLRYIPIENGYSVAAGQFYESATVELPHTVNGKPLTTISEGAFKNNKIVKTVIIPSSVTTIEAEAFRGCTGLTSITIPDSVTSIGMGAFRGCDSLESITLPFAGETLTGTSNTHFEYIFGYMFGDAHNYQIGLIPASLKKIVITKAIGKRAFSGCTGLTSITISDSVTSVGEYAFKDCKGLTSIAIPNSVTSIGDGAFSGCTGLTSIAIPSSVTSIGGGAFSGCTGLTSIAIPNSVTSIGGDAFSGCTGLTSIAIPNSVTSVGDGAFSGCIGLTSITVSGENTVYHSQGNCLIDTKNKALVAACNTSVIPIDGSVTSIGDSAFCGCTSLTSITIPDSVTSIGGDAFSGCTGLTSITIPDSVTSIGDCAFQYCTGLTSITIPNSVTSVGEYAFDYCIGLTSITIPNSVKSVGEYAFNYCIGLTSIAIPDSVTSIGDCAFQYCTGLTSITVSGENTVYHSRGNCLIDTKNKALVAACNTSVIPIDGSVTSIGKGAFTKCTDLTSITIPDSVTSIGDWAFSGCTGLTSITIPDSVTSIGYSAFSRCTGLTSITIPDSVTSIGYSAFSRCTGLTSITIPDSVTSIGNGAFYGCTGLTSITIPNSVASIGNGAFSRCTGLTSITIPNSVTSIGNYAFSGCTGLTSITVSGENTVYHSQGNCLIDTKNKALVAACNTSVIPIDGSVTSIGKGAFEECTGLTSITIPDSVTSIGDSAFGGCTGLASITIPDSVTNIGESAFEKCTGLTSITIPDSVTSIGDDVFYGCTGLTSIIFKGTNYRLH